MADQYLDKGTWLPVQQTQYYSAKPIPEVTFFNGPPATEKFRPQ